MTFESAERRKGPAGAEPEVRIQGPAGAAAPSGRMRQLDRPAGGAHAWWAWLLPRHAQTVALDQLISSTAGRRLHLGSPCSAAVAWQAAAMAAMAAVPPSEGRAH